MRRTFHFSTVVVTTLAIVAIAMGMGAGSVAADDHNASVHSIIDRTDPADAEPHQVETVQEWADDDGLEDLNESQRERVDNWLAASPDADAHVPEYVTRIDSETVITDWEFSGGQFIVQVHAEDDTTLTMAESADWEEGEGEYRVMQREVQEGNETLYVQTFADDDDGVALSFATDLSMEEERGPYISTGTEAAQDPFRHFGGASGLFSGVAMTVMLSAIGAGIVLYQEEGGVKTV